MVIQELIRLYEEEQKAEEEARARLQQAQLQQKHDRLEAWLQTQQSPWTLEQLQEALQQEGLELDKVRAWTK